MNLSYKTRILNFFRNIFKIPILEKPLAALTRGKSPNHFFSKLIPSHYQYSLSSFRSIEVHGINLTVDIGDYIGHCIYFGFNGTERNSYETLFSLCRPEFHILDVGANIGYTSLVMSSLAKDGAVAGFEPDPYSYQQIMDNFKKNRQTNVRCYNIGLGEQSGIAFLEERLKTCRGANRIATNDITGIEIKLETIDSKFPELNFKKIDLIKIDVEGYELKILKGAKALLNQFKPLLFIEVDENNLIDQGDSAKELVLFLEELGYNNITQADSDDQITHLTNFDECHFDLVARVK